MKVALRKGAAPDADALGRFSAEVIKVRLVTHYPHAGMVVGDTLYHATSRHGLTSQPFDEEGWRVVECGPSRDLAAVQLFEEHKGAGYDWISLLAFVMVSASDSQRWYCYEWCWYVMTGERPKGRVTPEMLLGLVAIKRAEAPK